MLIHSFPFAQALRALLLNLREIAKGTDPPLKVAPPFAQDEEGTRPAKAALEESTTEAEEKENAFEEATKLLEDATSAHESATTALLEARAAAEELAAVAAEMDECTELSFEAEATAKAGAEAAAKAATDLEVAKVSKEKAQVRDRGAYC